MAQVMRLNIMERHEPAIDHIELVFPITDSIVPARAGQFVQLLCRPEDTSDPLLRRPLSIYWKNDEAFSVLFRVVGRGTALLSRLKPGAPVDVLGPLGTGFQTNLMRNGSKAVLVGGGVGTPPIFFLSRLLETENIPHDVIVGFANKAQVIAVDRWHAAGIRPTITTDDGSAGHQGFVTDPLAKRLKAGDVGVVYACGPRPMLEAIANMCNQYNVPCQVSMEEWMGCGVGVCLSCVQKVSPNSAGQPGDDVGTHWARICVEGPVFDGKEVVWS